MKLTLMLALLSLAGDLPAQDETWTAVRDRVAGGLADAERLLAGHPEQSRALLRQAAGELGSALERQLVAAADRPALSSLVRRLARAAETAAFQKDDLEQVIGELILIAPAASGLNFRSSYVSGKGSQQSAGGHSSDPGPEPPRLDPDQDLAVLKGTPLHIDFSEGPVLPVRTHAGSASREHLLESVGTGVGLLDYDRDGLLDIFIVNAFELTAARVKVAHSHRLFKNLGGWEFEDTTRQAGLAETAVWGAGVCAGDVDEDGWIDLYVTNFGPNQLFRNNRDGTFSETAAQFGMADPGWGTGCAFFDADADGDLDLYVANYVEADWLEVLAARRSLSWRGGPLVLTGPAGLPGAADVFYRNEEGSFEDRTNDFGLTDRGPYYGLGVLASDLDLDGLTDLYVANDSQPNYLYRGLPGGGFQETGLTGGAALSGDGRAQAGMGVEAGDVDGDGLPDILVTNFARDTNTLYRNQGHLQFEDATAPAGLQARTYDRLGWGVALLDADLDGQLDLFFANGHIYPQVDDFPELGESYRQLNQLLLNRGGLFLDVSRAAGSALRVPRSHRGLAAGDLDNDGDLDLVVTSLDDYPALLRNGSLTGGHWIGLEFRKPGPNPLAIGGRVTLRSGSLVQIREIRSGGSYLSQNDLRIHFGLGERDQPVEVDLVLPGGFRHSWKELAVDRYHRLEAGTGTLP